MEVCWRRHPSGFTLGPVREPVPIEPVVVAIGHDREVPSSVSIYAGELSHFPIVFNLVDYVSTTSEYSCDNTAVTLSLYPEYNNILTVAVDAAAAVGSVATIKFRNQVIMHVTFAEKPKLPDFQIFKDEACTTYPAPFENLEAVYVRNNTGKTLQEILNGRTELALGVDEELVLQGPNPYEYLFKDFVGEYNGQIVQQVVGPANVGNLFEFNLPE